MHLLKMIKSTVEYNATIFDIPQGSTYFYNCDKTSLTHEG